MPGCCAVDPTTAGGPRLCPESGTRGRSVPLITLKSLLRPEALERLDAGRGYQFCAEPDCEVVYFSDAAGPVFFTDELKVPVFPKAPGDDVPVCYCFGWTRRRIREELARTGRTTAPERIKANVQRKICGCEVNNPQGACCLGNVHRVVAELSEPRGPAPARAGLPAAGEGARPWDG